MTQLLTKKIAYDTLQNFFSEKPMVFLGTGASCALDKKFGMPALKRHLVDTFKTDDFSKSEKTEWGAVKKDLQTDVDFESAMDRVTDGGLLKKIKQATADFLNDLNQKYADQISMGKRKWPAIDLFKRLVAGLPETDRKLHVATSNYDLLAESAFEHANIPYTNGFVGGICRRLDWDRSERGVSYVEKNPKGNKILKNRKIEKHIRLYKVHGSLNTFKLLNGDIVENNSWIRHPPEDTKRLMIMPGKSKHEKLGFHRNEMTGCFDNAVKAHSAFLFIGFGFNDADILNNALKTKLVKRKCQGLIITRDTNKNMMKWLEESDHLWLVCKKSDADNGSMIFNRKYNNRLSIEGIRLWETKEFSKTILGGG